MVQWLKQSTAATVKMGPFLDSTDGVTAETGLTISQADIRLSKNGGNIAQTNNATGATHDELGYYDVPLDTTDTATLGTLRVAIHESGALPVWQDFMVVPANVWDSLFGSDKLQVDAVQLNGTSQTARDIGASVLVGDKTGFSLAADQSGVTIGTVNALGTQAKADVNAEADTALSDYDPPTNAEMVARTLLAASYATAANQSTLATASALTTVDTVVDSILAIVNSGTHGNAALKTLIDALPTANANADALLDRANGVETGLTPRQALRVVAAALFGKLSGAGTATNTFRNAVADSKDRITATVDADGNRSAITLDLT